MVKCLKIKKEFGAAVKKFLVKKGWLDTTRIIGKTAQRYLIFPLIEKFKEKELLKKFKDASIVDRSLQKMPTQTGTLKDLLRGIIPEKYIDEVIRSYDVIGDIAIIDVPKKLQRLEKSIAWTLKRAHPHIKVVARKAGKVGDTYRIRKLEILVGEDRTETLHKEFGVEMKVDLAKAYFSPRSSGERMRIASQVKANEKVLLACAGIGAYALVIAKKQPKCKIWAVELNPDAVRYMEENIRINRVGHIITPILGDVKEVIPKLKEKFNRIIMVLPESCWKYLDLLFKVAAKGAIVHFYVFEHEDKLKDADKKIKQIAKKQNCKVKILDHIRAGTYAPKVYRWCVEFKIL